MKYYLFIGYQLIDKNKNNPKIRIFCDNDLIDEFTCDNESSTTLVSEYVEHEKESGKQGTASIKRHVEFSFDTPKKMKLYELDSSSWHSDSEIKIQVCDNNSNYNNAFMTKSSIVLLNPVFLIPKWLYEDQSTMEKILIRSARHLSHLPKWKGIDFSDSRVQWPGHCINPECLTYSGYENNLRSLFSGGDYERTFIIKHKHGIHFITQEGKNTVGFFQLDRFTHAWYQWMRKYKFYFFGSSCNDGIGSKVIRNMTIVKKDINTEK